MTTTETSGSPATPTPLLRTAASLLVVRDAPAGMEVLLVRRVERANDRSSGAYVFPGGTLDAQDRHLHAHAHGLDDVLASERLGLPASGLDFYLAAVRECFEEAGLLFACDHEGRLRSPHELDAAQQELLRQAVQRGGPGLAHACEQLGLRLAADRLAYHSYWLTPPGLPKRFDTRFFVAIAPEGQLAVPDGTEIVEHRWVRPAEAADPATRRPACRARRHRDRRAPLGTARRGRRPGQRPADDACHAPDAELDRAVRDCRGVLCVFLAAARHRLHHAAARHRRRRRAPGDAERALLRRDRPHRSRRQGARALRACIGRTGAVVGTGMARDGQQWQRDDRPGHQYLPGGRRRAQRMGRDRSRPGRWRARACHPGGSARPDSLDSRHAHAPGPFARGRGVAGRHRRHRAGACRARRPMAGRHLRAAARTGARRAPGPG
ncbi:hypothetical protein CT19431_MP110015 [Cupriavidus taiwanensis]|nr:hypothetical protein CT19431_MP110015 [Cupriavidus taiwanensis]